jgi:alanyl-tRNA synthetase
MGLERLASILQGVDTNYGTDLFVPYISHVEGLTGKKYKESADTEMAMNVIADHIRAVTFAVGDGAAPSNEGRGYVIRRLLRRAVRYGRTLGLNEPFLVNMVPLVADVMDVAYPVLREKAEFIQKVIRQEEERFLETLDEGTQMLAAVIKELRAKGEHRLDGQTAFRLYDTFGFPLDLTDDIAREQGFEVDREGFTSAMEAQRQRARAARGDAGGDFGKTNLFPGLHPTRFLGYTETTVASSVVGLLCEGVSVEIMRSGETGAVILGQSPFYAEAGGQVGDRGIISWDQGTFQVENTVKYFGDLILHTGHMVKGELRVNEAVRAQVDEPYRAAVARAHTATHLLHAALSKVLGNHAAQAGSLVEADRLRFDFSHFSSLTATEMAEIEALVNKAILSGDSVAAHELTMEEARERGATMLFGEKYGETVRVVEMGSFSRELCGGTHLNATSEIGMFQLLGESGIGAGLRRVEAVTGAVAYERIRHMAALLDTAAERLKCSWDDIPRRVDNVLQQSKDADKQVARLHSRLMSLEAGEYVAKAATVEGVTVVARAVTVPDMESLRTAADAVREKMNSGVLVLGAAHDGKVSLVALVTDDLLPKGLHAGNLIREVAKLTGGGGGGRANMAQAGGKDPEKLHDALATVPALVRGKLKL